MRKGTVNTAICHSLFLSVLDKIYLPTLVVTQLVINALGVVLYNLLAIL